VNRPRIAALWPPVLLLTFSLVLAGCSTIEGILFGDAEDIPGDTTAPPVAPVPYDVRYDGTLDDQLKADIKAASILIARRDRLPASIAALYRRVQDDIDRVQQVLKSHGYYAGVVTPSIDADADPAQVVIDVQPGQLFQLTRYRIVYAPPPPPESAPTLASDVNLKLGQPASAEPLVTAEQQILRQLQERAHPDARIVDRRYVANPADHSISAEITVDAGPAARFGPLHISGLDRVDPAYIDRIARWTPGEPYDIRKVERLRTRLVRTGLFDSVALEGSRPGTTTTTEAKKAPPPTSDVVPIDFAVVERAPRSVSLGVTYSTDDEGFGGEASWEHRNLFGHAERLTLTARGSEVRQEVVGQFRKPNVIRLNQALVANANFTNEDSDAFRGLIAGAFVGVERKFLRHWTITAGPAAEISRIRQSGETDRFVIMGANSTIVYDRRNDPLNPTRGMIATASLAPYTSVAATNTRFLVIDESLSGYLPVIGEDRLVLAARGRLGNIVSKSTDEIPANQHLYAGGGGSVRGYAFRSIGPLDHNGDPLGGRSAIEANVETRIKVTEQVGVVPFVDGGQVYGNTIPSFDEDLQWAAGLGLRYFSAVGPLRLDVAVPINKRDVDDPFQVYFSIGQAF
jgi:translocation and assembly module TamA